MQLVHKCACTRDHVYTCVFKKEEKIISLVDVGACKLLTEKEINVANEEVQKALEQTEKSQRRGKYNDYTSKQGA